MRHFAFNLADIVTLIVFMVLGANIPFDQLGDNLLPALAVLATLMLVARPLTVFASTMPDRGARWTREELTFMCWTRETGVVPAALVGVLAGLGVPETEVFASVVALAVVLTLLLQALPARWLAERLGLLEPRTQPVAVSTAAGHVTVMRPADATSAVVAVRREPLGLALHPLARRCAPRQAVDGAGKSSASWIRQISSWSHGAIGRPGSHGHPPDRHDRRRRARCSRARRR